MTHATVAPEIFTVDAGRSRWRLSARPGAALLACGVLVGALVVDAGSAFGPDMARLGRRTAPPAPAYAALLDPAYSLGPAPASLAGTAPLAAEFQFSAPVDIAAAVEPVVEEATAPVEVHAPSPAPPIAQAVETVPFPTPRPPALRSPASVPSAGHVPSKMAGPATVSPDNRNFLQKFFGMQQQPAGPMLAYAAPDDGALTGNRPLAGNSMTPYDHWTAIYDISAHTVYLPNGTKLEAHSGLGDRLDDPRHVSERNRGATPPNVYTLEARAQLFHGVRALRLNPVNGGGTFGRTGLLAHTFMLGPNGDSNGCVSFRDYNSFLQAFANGDVRRLAVVARQI